MQGRRIHLARAGCPEGGLMLAIFQVPTSSSADGRVVDASGQDWNETWVTPASVQTLNSALTGGVSQNHFRKLNDEGS
jgi:hypothetical protein